VLIKHKPYCKIKNVAIQINQSKNNGATPLFVAFTRVVWILFVSYWNPMLFKSINQPKMEQHHCTSRMQRVIWILFVSYWNPMLFKSINLRRREQHHCTLHVKTVIWILFVSYWNPMLFNSTIQ
jgi:hypothetical protein